MKTPLLLMVISAGTYASAQTINLSDTLSSGDSQTYYVLDSNATAYADLTGADVTWDYGSIGGYGIGPNINSVIPGETSDFGEDFPDAVYAENFENSINTFFTNDPGASEVIVSGFVFQELSNDFIIKYDINPLISAKFPMTLGTTYDDAIQGTATLPLAGDVAIEGSATITVDGSGTLKVGSSSYTDILRVHTIEVSEGIILGSPAVITRESYVYYDIAADNMAIFIHGTVLAELGAGGDFGFTAVYSIDEITEIVGVEETATEKLDLTVYPNPANGNFTTISTVEGTESLTILNSLGQVVSTYNNPSTQVKVDVSELNTGVYFVQAIKGSATRTEKFIVK
ncbi:MAG: T9SS type A sorting domain-containing protein [Crocinitomix sp.]|nr:T9SS type A sorting domain-containing protein [Crocinitomix sp.]